MNVLELEVSLLLWNDLLKGLFRNFDLKLASWQSFGTVCLPSLGLHIYYVL